MSASDAKRPAGGSFASVGAWGSAWPPAVLVRRGMDSGLGRWPLIAWLATSQHGVVALWQLVELCVPPSTVRRWCRRGYLHRLTPGIYAVGHRQIGADGNRMAAVLAAGGGAVVVGRSAIAAHRLGWEGGGPVEVAVPGGGGRTRSGFVVRRLGQLQRADLTVAGGVPSTSVPRSLLDFGAAAGGGALREAVARAQQAGSLDRAALHALVERSKGVRGVAILREVCSELLPGGGMTRRGVEQAFLSLCRRSQLPPPVVNGLVQLEHRTIQVDFHWPAARLVVETDGYDSHSDIVAHEEDRRRDQELAQLGWRVLRFTWRQVTEEPARTSRLIAELLALDPAREAA